MATRAAAHANEIGINKGWGEAERTIMVACAYLIVNAGLAGEFQVGATQRTAQASEWIQYTPRAEHNKFISDCLTDLNFRAAGISLLAVKWNWYQTNHHTGQQDMSAFVKKYLTIAWGHLMGTEGIACTEDQVKKVMWLCGHWASTHLMLKAWGFDWEGTTEIKTPTKDMPPLEPGVTWDQVDANGDRFVIPISLNQAQREEMWCRARHFFDFNMVEDRASKRFKGVGKLRRVYPYGYSENWVHQYLNLDTDLHLRRDSFPAGTRPIATSVAAVQSFLRGHSSILVLIDDLDDFVTSAAALDAIEEQSRPMFHMGAPYLTNRPRRMLKAPSLLGRAGMLVQACMEGTAMSRSPMFKPDGKCQDAPDYDPSRIQALRAYRHRMGSVGGEDVERLLKVTQSATGEARSRAVLTGLQMEYTGDRLKNVVRRCLSEAKVARGQSAEVSDQEVNKEFTEVVAEINAAKTAGREAVQAAHEAAVPPGGEDNAGNPNEHVEDEDASSQS